MDLIGYSDADWASSYDRKSTSGCVYKFGYTNGAISWRSTKQYTVALSSCEAEYIALAEAVKEAIYPRRLLSDLGLQPKCVRLYCENNGIIALAHNPIHKQQSKHIDIRYHFLRDYFRSGEGLLVHIPSENNVADILTKALGKVKFLLHFQTG